MFDPLKPYNELPFVSDIVLDMTPELIDLREEARVSIELLNYALKSLPNTQNLLDTLAMQEARVSNTGVFSITTEDFSVTTTEKQSFKIDETDVTVSFGISRKHSSKVGDPPLTLHSTMILEFQYGENAVST